MKNGIYAVSLALAAIAGTAGAQMGMGNTSATTSTDGFASYDVNQDGVISRTEAATDSSLRSSWTDLDANRDDQLDEGEFARFEAEGDAEGSLDGE